MVEVYDGDKKLGETKADQAGNYRFSLPTLAPGQHTLSTRTNDANGNRIASSAPIPVTVSGGQVAQVSPIPAGAKPGALAPTFTDLPQGTQWPSGMPVMLSGTAPPGSKVQVFANDKLAGETVAGQDGKWSLPQPPLPKGDHFLTTARIRPEWRTAGRISACKGDGCRPGYADRRREARGRASDSRGRPGYCRGWCCSDSNRCGHIGGWHGCEGDPDGFAGNDGDADNHRDAAERDGGRHARNGCPSGSGHPAAQRCITGTTRPTGVLTGTPRVARPTGAITGTLGSTQPGGTAATATAAARSGTPAPAAGTAPPRNCICFERRRREPARGRAHLPGGHGETQAPSFDIFSGNTQVGEAVADAVGQWRLMLPALQAGTYELVQRVFDAAGKQMSSSAPLTVTVPGAATPTPGKSTPVATGTPSGRPRPSCRPSSTGRCQGQQCLRHRPVLWRARPSQARRFASTTATRSLPRLWWGQMAPGA